MEPNKNPLYLDLEAYALEFGATLTVPHFVSWLREHRPNLVRIPDQDLAAMATECLYRFAYESYARDYGAA